MGYKIITQLGLIVAAFVLVFTVITPKLSDIRNIQDDVKLYTDAINDADLFQDQLNDLLNKEQVLSKDQKKALDVFLPTIIDPVAVMADISVIAETSLMEITDLGETDTSNKEISSYYNNPYGSEEDITEQSPLEYTDFSLSAKGTYQALKNVLTMFEFNKYPLEIVSLTFTEMTKPEVDGVPIASAPYMGEYSMTIRVYSFINK